jgi:lia operon protein LiaG
MQTRFALSRAALAVATLPLAGTSLALAALTAQPVNAQERHVLGGTSTVIWNLAGEVRVEPGTGSDVVVEVTRGGTDGRRLVVTAAGGQLIVKYPDDQVVYRGRGGDSDSRWGRGSTTLNVRSDGTFNGQWNGGGRRTQIRTSGSGLEAHADLVVKVPRGKRVEVNLAVGAIDARDVDADLKLDVHTASVRTIGTKGRLMIDATSGSTRVENAEGDLEIDTSSGSTTVIGFRGSRVSIDASSGSITARDVRAERFSADVSSGSVTVEGLSADDLLIDTSSGSVRVDLLKVPRRSEIDTSSGGVTVSLPGDAGVELDIDTGSGGISTDFAVAMREIRRNELRGKIGEGGGVLRVSTSSGGVRLVKR